VQQLNELNLNWSEWKEIFTHDLKRMRVREAIPTREFRLFWAQNKDYLKEKGFSFSNYSGVWRVQQWQNLFDIILPPISSITLKYPELLLDYQIDHLKKIILSSRYFHTTLDGSDTGTGKMYIACALAKERDLDLFVIAPLSVLSAWRYVAEKIFKIKIIAVNYELIKLCKIPTYRQSKRKIKGKYSQIREVHPCPYLKRKQKKTAYDSTYDWTDLPKNTLLVFDEAHRCRNYKSQTTDMLVGAKDSKCQILLSTATLGFTPMDMSATGYVLGLFPKHKDFFKWARFHKCGDKWDDPFVYVGGAEEMKLIHDEIYSCKGSRMCIKDLGDKFPKLTLKSEPINMGKNTRKIQDEYNHLHSELQKMTPAQRRAPQGLEQITYARMNIEMLKVPTMVELAKDYMDSGSSVAIFVNYTKTLIALSTAFETDSVIWGNQTQSMRDFNIKRFQINECPIILCNIQAGGVGISLHDPISQKPRVGIYNPTFNAIDFKQAMGRLVRAKGGPALEILLFAANTYEENICGNIRGKLENLDSLNNRDLTGDLFDF